MTDEAMLLREAAYNLSGTDPQETQALMQMAANKIDELRAKLAEQKLITLDHEMADYKGECDALKAKLESQQPVAWIDTDDISMMRKFGRGGIVWHTKQKGFNQTPLYLSAGAKPNE